MNFSSLLKTWEAGNPSTRKASRIEHRSATGTLLAPGITLCDEVTVIHGSGRVEFKRRGDFGEREDYRPGSWSSVCEPSQVERLWRQLGSLGPGSFPARVADPGDTMQYLTGYIDGRVGTLTIGPSDHSKPAPGDAFMEELYQVLNRCEEGECHWAVESRLGGLVRVGDGAEADIRFRNPGLQAIGLVFDGDAGAPDFHFRFAQHRKDMPYPEWRHCGSQPSEAKDIKLVLLEPGMELIRKVHFPCGFPDQGTYIGKISYRQARYLDMLAGIPILTGIAHTEMAEFTI